MSRINLDGQRFGRWVVIGIHSISRHRTATWLCRCDCGSEKAVSSQTLRRGESKSCGCLCLEIRRELGRRVGLDASSRIEHGRARTPEYRAWSKLKARCLNPRDQNWVNYGERGIGVCVEWQSSFVAFFEHVGPRPSPKHSIDRINNDGDYEPGNVRWATASQQARNKRRSAK
jgi:hypothetical protein